MSEPQLSGYSPEAPSSGGFEPFKFNGVVTITKSVISKNDEAEVAEGEFKTRKLWKRFNLDDEKEDKNGKTPSMKLADQLFAAKVSFFNEDPAVRLAQLIEVNEQFVGMALVIKAWVIKWKKKSPTDEDRDDTQAWNIKDVAPDGWEDSLHLDEPATAGAENF